MVTIDVGVGGEGGLRPRTRSSLLAIYITKPKRFSHAFVVTAVGIDQGSMALTKLHLSVFVAKAVEIDWSIDRSVGR